MDPWEQSQTIDPEVRAYVQSLVNAVGGRSNYDETYAVGDDASAALLDLVKWLRLYDEKLHRWDVKRCLAEANLLKGDLLEILALWSDDQTDSILKSKLALICLQLMVPLTWPMTDEKDDERFTVNNARHFPYLQLAQVGYKRAILGCELAPILRTVVRIALPAMAQPKRERSPRSKQVIKLVLYLFRNLANITQPQHLPSQGDENDISRSATVEAFQSQDVFNLLLTIGSNANDEFQEVDAVLLEVLFHLLKGVDAKKLFMEKEQMAEEETNELLTLMQREKAMLGGYKKSAPTRHNRFGTMIWIKRDNEKMSTLTGQNSITDESTILKQMDSNKKWNKPQYRGKLTKEFDENSDFGMRVDLSDSARKHLRTFVEDFLDSSFNPLFSSLRKLIERDDPQIIHSIHDRQYFYLIHWFLDAECARRDQSYRTGAWNADRTTQAPLEENTFAYVAAVLDQKTFVLLNRAMQMAFDEKKWQDLQATLLCFTQILLTVKSMSESKDEEDQEIAENILSRIFYEETTHDRIVQVLRGYTHQGFAYLDTVTECVHVFVKLLEGYSKQNVDLMVRSKRRSRKKNKDKQNTAVNDEEEDAEDTREAHMAVSERKFDFAKFSAKFLSQGCVDTFVAMSHYYKDLSPSQLKRCHRYFYRLAFKHELAVYLFRVDIIQLFYQMIKGPGGLSPELEGFNDWHQLIQAVFRKCTKWIERTSEGEGWKEMAMIEMLFSKIPNSLFYLQNGFERVVEKRAPRPPAELDFKSSVPAHRKLDVAMALMMSKDKSSALDWVKKELKRAIDERKAWEDGQSAMAPAEDEDGQPLEPMSAPSIFLFPDKDSRKMELFKDKHLRLLLTTLGCQRLGTAEDVDASWIIPHDITSAQLQASLDNIKEAEYICPTFEALDDKSAEELVRNRNSTSRKANTYSDTESDADASLDEDSLFPPNQRAPSDPNKPSKPKKKRLSRREKTDLTEEDIALRAAERKRKEKERNSKIKSALYITADDDVTDDEADAEFFRLEEERRLKNEGAMREQLVAEREMLKGKGKKRKSAGDGETGGKRKKRRVEEEDDDSSAVSTPAGHVGDTEDEEMGGEGEETPSTSPHAENVEQPLKEISGNVVPSRPVMFDEDDEDEDEVVKPAPARRNVRAGIIIDDSDDE